MWAHSSSRGQQVWHGFAEHSRSTARLARSFAERFGAGELAEALGLWHDAGKCECGWQERLLVAGPNSPVGGNHWSLGARMLRDVIGPFALPVEGHHGGLPEVDALRHLRPQPDDELTLKRFYDEVAEARNLLAGVTIPESWQKDFLAAEMGLRMTFSALVDADHLDTAAHFDDAPAPDVSVPADMAALFRRFEVARTRALEEREPSSIDKVRSELYDSVLARAGGPRGVYRLPAPTGSGKTYIAAGFALKHAAQHQDPGHEMRRVIVAVPFITITEQNAQIYRNMLGDDVVLEHHSNLELDARWARLGAENWDAPFVVTTTVQLFDSLFGRKPSRSRKLHRLANAVVVLDEVQSLPLPLLVPILDGLRLLCMHFGTTVLLTSATQPPFETLDVWKRLRPSELVPDAPELFAALRRAEYEWRVDPKPTTAELAVEIAEHDQTLVVVNTVEHARRMYRLLRDCATVPVLHLSTRMCPAHRVAVLARVNQLLKDRKPVIVVATQLIEAGVDIDFPIVYRALAPAESLQQAAGRANREGRLAMGRVVVFDAADAPIPEFYRTAVGSTRVYFGPGRADPDSIVALRRYYLHLYRRSNIESGERARVIQANRGSLDFPAVADGPEVDGGAGGRDPALAFRMLDDDSVPVVVTNYDKHGHAERLLQRALHSNGRSRQVFRDLQPYTVSFPTRLVTACLEAGLLSQVVGELYRWQGPYDRVGVGIDENQNS
ncbi:CRISPR-associated helicase Cas3' [Nocardia sp. CDC160]|uniref:CRISPR-associated helicase Cas3' n=1 Tax=Nocardia sp. CDC160 TaxID=3112166 RepID=UPI002DB95241|nr:CRISPR-associated helicase Cas3' [Nocardia sp. CDC160]MEC3915972.1 CRISPR-associated helicase Cas3' [Nocardia sp. CDC160]